ncbi:MAG: ATP synthase F1 subunit delta [Acidobacteriota bacterium]|jgi:F-type H+-transporting ATPase subunit delta
MITSVTMKYAKALAEVAFEVGTAEMVAGQLTEFVKSMDESRELSDALANPAYPLLIKQEIVRKVAARMKLQPIVLNFLLLLVERNRIAQLESMRDGFQRVLDDHAGVVQVLVVSSHELPEAVRKGLEQALRRLTGEKVRLEYQLDESLIGGVKLQIGSTVYDGTVRTQLDHLRQELSV